MDIEQLHLNVDILTTYSTYSMIVVCSTIYLSVTVVIYDNINNCTYVQIFTVQYTKHGNS